MLAYCLAYCNIAHRQMSIPSTQPCIIQHLSASATVVSHRLCSTSSHNLEYDEWEEKWKILG